MGIVRYVDVLTACLFTLLLIGILTYLWLKKKKSSVFLIFFTLFYVYIFKVLDYTLFKFQTLLILKYVMPDLMLRGLASGNEVNIIPLITLTPEDIVTSLLNILLFVPFGFGLPFLTKVRMKKTVILGVFFSIIIELLQLSTGKIANITFRIADINDVLFNTGGVAIGYLFFMVFVCLCHYIIHEYKVSTNPILKYITERPQVNKGIEVLKI